MWIPKPGSDTEKRPLGIPTIAERALQALVKAALEPEWEARFEPNSYGFRPGRSTHDAVEAIFNGISLKAKYVLDAEDWLDTMRRRFNAISKCRASAVPRMPIGSTGVPEWDDILKSTNE